ncbi:SDR family NAD(P)-dependent oxidoreductase [Nocardia uniformis]|uniref:SDR family NAD(P)-dependent oxidoreductase n=1 Tax=Nocardia uniformis TaxID=53432 RepID=A0A849CAT4_9NOCA|nr:SDR family NAD(P)-dependent oxidoreductase [Nocardia uniformis]NNH75642.1 SDR family NAD(P)-dependent oxidoreductase [Nocardia uniformis]
MNAPRQRVGVVLGASSGVGAALTERLAGSGDMVIAASRRGTAPERLGVIPARVDVRDPASLRDLFAVASGIGALDWLVNASGVGFYAPVRRGFHKQWADILETNVVGTLNLLAEIRELSSPPDQVITIGSLAALRPSRTVGNQVYGISKAAVATVIGRARGEARAAGSTTRFTLVHPGFIGATDFTEKFFDRSPESATALLSEFPPLTPGEVADVIVYVLGTPSSVEISEIVVRPTAQPD